MSYLDEVFGPAGFFASAFPGYEPRDGQIALAKQVDSAIRNCRSALVEGPTGTGKSVGYLVPLIYHLHHNAKTIVEEREDAPRSMSDELADLNDELQGTGGEREPARALVVTANIALQEQLVGKDVPLLQRILPWPFTAAIAKGRANYLCHDRFDDSVAEYLLEPPRDYDDRRQWNEVAAWASTTQTGDFSELPFEIRPSLKPRLAVTADDCLGKSCPRRLDCHAEKAKQSVAKAQIIVTNYHLLFAHLALAMEGAAILPRFDIVVMDEAHEASDIARDFFGFRITAGSIRHAARLLVPGKVKGKKAPLPEIDRELHEQITASADHFFEQLREHRRSREYFARIRDERVAEPEGLCAGLLKASTLYQGMADNGGLEAARAAELRRAARRVKLLRGNIEAAMSLEGALGKGSKKGGSVYFIEEEERDRGPARVTLCARPLDVAPMLRESLFEALNLRCTVATSATLATGRGADAFDFAVKQLGAEDADELLVDSPFDHQRQALLVLPKEVPDPSSKDFADRLAPIIVRAVEEAQGRTLGLFTSRKGLRIAAEALRTALGEQYVILVQGEAPRMQLVKRFKDDVSSVLLGTKSFWAGVDVPGEALSCVLVDRIPFDPPDDPILDALSERSRATFTEYSIPRAAVELRQGFGRLIRSRQDRGVVVLLDKRLVSKGYGKKILRALPDAPISNDLGDIGRFLRARAPARRRSAVAGVSR